ncbi:hypothetical protein RhiirA4_452148 [Rhizophagus irregularis]|uniref:Uncharacterized protein n=1 Tax=Rhizophagus irregularis TaxID=588596 RepID=A0A2I1FXE7_9GLOM|nr:hypothetical protein RhiirA4_452148 [Rhizophagus irregularis]
MCDVCYEFFIPSGNKVIDDFISYTLSSNEENGRMIFVPYYKFKNIELIGGKIYKAIWIDSKISWWGTQDYPQQNESEIVALKKLNNSRNITSKELNELKMFYHYSSNRKNKSIYAKFDFVNIYYDITQDPITQDFIFIMPYYNSDLTHYIIKDFYKVKICDLGTSKSATENDDNNDNEEDNVYGIIPCVVPETFLG